jgi:cell division protein FtsL
MKKILVIVLVLIIILAGSGIGFYITIGNLNLLQTELQTAQNLIAEQNKTIDNNNNSINDLRAQLNDSNAKSNEMQTHLNDLNSQINTKNKELDDTKNTLADTSDILAKAISEKTEIEAQVTSYRDGFNNSKLQLDAAQNKIILYRNTYGDINSGVTPVGAIDDGTLQNKQRLFNLKRNPTATDPTWNQLLKFFQTDYTDEKPYKEGLYTCGNYAEDTFNNAESIGIKTAVVCITFKDNRPGHALNAFKTVDKGMVYIDCTGAPEGVPHPRMVTQVDLKLGQPYFRKFILDNVNYYFMSWGEVTSISLYW